MTDVDMQQKMEESAMELTMTQFNPDESMYHIKCKKGDVGRYVLLPGDPFRTDIIAEYLDNPQVVAHNREHKIWTGFLDGCRVSVCSTGMGCPSTAIALEELILCGADTFIRVGTAGRVSELSQNETVDGAICTAAIRDEGTTKQYIPIEYPAVADRHLVNCLSQAAKKRDYNAIEGITHSKDAFYGEIEPDSCPNSENLKSRWKAWVAGNVVCSEMECAALFVISSIRGCRASGIMSLRTGEKHIRKTIQVGCDAIKMMIKNDRK